MQPLWRTVWRFLKKLKIELPYDPAILLLDIDPEKMKTLIQKEACMPRACARQQREATAMRSPCTARKSSPRSPELKKARAQHQRPNAAKNK